MCCFLSTCIQHRGSHIYLGYVISKLIDMTYAYIYFPMHIGYFLSEAIFGSKAANVWVCDTTQENK